MLKSRNWIYLDLEKTGCTFLRRKLLKIYSQDYFEITQKHQPIKYNYSIPKIITIREAESYYYSLWSYGLKKKGGLYKIIRLIYPEKIDFFYKSASKDSFSYFLDFALSVPYRYPKIRFSRKNILNMIFNLQLLKSPSNKKIESQRNYLSRLFLQEKWLPDSCDIYTARILEMLIAKSERVDFINNLKADLSYENLNKNLKIYIPEIIIRTNSLNKDFYTYYQNNKLNFLNLPKGWKHIFSLKDIPINKSSNSSNKLKSRNLEKYLSNYHKDLIRSKSNLANLLLDKAEEKLKTEN